MGPRRVLISWSAGNGAPHVDAPPSVGATLVLRVYQGEDLVAATACESTEQAVQMADEWLAGNVTVPGLIDESSS